jgi:RimJ/RimL family protein N-acetyltransferase
MSKEYLRKVDYSDMELLYRWANDPETRKNSFHPDLIHSQEHKKWFEEKINSPDVLFFIYHYDGHDIGQLRFEFRDNALMINYSIDPSFRGKGHGCQMIVLGEEIIKKEYPVIKLIQAEVKYENKASQSIFRKLNYSEYQETTIIKFIKNIHPPDRNSND